MHLFFPLTYISKKIFLYFVLFLVHAINLASVCPFSLASLVPYGQRERPHYPAPQSTPAKQTAQTSQTQLEPQSTWQLHIPVNCGKFSLMFSIMLFIDIDRERAEKFAHC